MLYSHTIKLVRFYNGVDGLKTGYTSEAGYCLTATATKNNMRLIAVAMGEESSSVRNTEITNMLDYGFAKIKTVEVVNPNTVIKKIEVNKSNKKYVEVVPIDKITIVKNKNEKIGNITYSLKIDNVKAPIKKGEIIGKLIIKEDGKNIKEAPVTVKKDVKKASLIELYLKYINDIIDGEISFKY